MGYSKTLFAIHEHNSYGSAFAEHRLLGAFAADNMPTAWRNFRTQLPRGKFNRMPASHHRAGVSARGFSKKGDNVPFLNVVPEHLADLSPKERF